MDYFWCTFRVLLGHFWSTFGALLEYFWGTFGVLLGYFWNTFTRSCDEDMISTRKSHNCAGTAFVQGYFVGGSKLIEQTLQHLNEV